MPAVSTSLSKPQIRFLRARAHSLRPVLMIGDKGLTDSVLAELEQVLETHELIKVSIAGAEREQRQEITAALCQHSQAQLVQIIGRTSILYRPARKPRLVVPKNGA